MLKVGIGSLFGSSRIVEGGDCVRLFILSDWG